MHGLLSTWRDSPRVLTGSAHGQILFDSLTNNINEDTWGWLSAFVVVTKLEATVNMLKERRGIQKDFIRLELWAESNTGCRESWLNRDSHEKDLGIWSESKLNMRPRCQPTKAKAFLSCIKRNGSVQEGECHCPGHCSPQTNSEVSCSVLSSCGSEEHWTSRLV